MVRAFDKRQVDMADLDRITTEIEQTIQNTLEREVTTDRIGQMVMERIKRAFYSRYVNSSVVLNYRIGPISDPAINPFSK